LHIACSNRCKPQRNLQEKTPSGCRQQADNNGTINSSSKAQRRSIQAAKQADQNKKGEGAVDVDYYIRAAIATYGSP
jgi:hypothetical protein